MSNFYIGQRIRIVKIDGCMAHRRGLTREGRIQLFYHHRPWGASQNMRFARIQMDDGTIEERPVETGDWSMFDSRWEYHE